MDRVASCLGPCVRAGQGPNDDELRNALAERRTNAALVLQDYVALAIYME
jgi:hypothetical protein